MRIENLCEGVLGSLLGCLRRFIKREETSSGEEQFKDANEKGQSSGTSVLEEARGNEMEK